LENKKFPLHFLRAFAILSPDMKKLYCFTIQNKQGVIRNVEVAGDTLIHAMKRLGDKLKPSDKLKDFTSIKLTW
jgi:hypothetical protein